MHTLIEEVSLRSQILWMQILGATLLRNYLRMNYALVNELKWIYQVSLFFSARLFFVKCYFLNVQTILFIVGRTFQLGASVVSENSRSS